MDCPANSSTGPHFLPVQGRCRRVSFAQHRPHLISCKAKAVSSSLKSNPALHRLNRIWYTVRFSMSFGAPPVFKDSKYNVRYQSGQFSGGAPVRRLFLLRAPLRGRHGQPWKSTRLLQDHLARGAVLRARTARRFAEKLEGAAALQEAPGNAGLQSIPGAPRHGQAERYGARADP